MNKSEKYKDLFDNEHIIDNLKGKTVRGGIWTIIGQICSYVLRFGSTIILARLLTPKDYGLIAMVSVFTNFLQMFKDMGLSTATIQKPQITHQQVSNLFWINITVSILLGFGLAACSPIVSWFYNEPRLFYITFSLAVSFPLGGFAIQHQALLRRQMKFKQISIAQILSMLFGIFIAIISALNGLKYWTLILMQITNLAAYTIIICCFCPWIPSLPQRKSGSKSMILFGGSISAFNFLNYFSRNADSLLLGKFWGTDQLAFYDKGYQLLLLPIRQLSRPLQAVALPILSRVQNDQLLFKMYYSKMLSVIYLVTTPICVFFCLFSNKIIIVCLGNQWEETTPIFRYLSFSMISQIICNMSGTLYIARGLGKELLKWGGIGSIIIVTSFIIGLPFASKGIALSYTVAIIIWTVPCMLFATKGTSITLADIFKGLPLPLLVSLVIGLILFGISYSITLLSVEVILCLTFLAYTSIYIIVMMYVFNVKTLFREILISMRTK